METTKTKSTLRKRLKGSIKALQSQRDELKERRKKIDKKVKVISSKNGKKKKAKDLKGELKKLLKKESKLKSNLKVHKTKLGELKASKSKDQKKKNSAKKAVKKKAKIDKKEDIPVSKPEKIEAASAQTPDPTQISISFNARDAISLLRKISDLHALGQFISRETRVTVQAAAKSRRNAIIRSEGWKENR
ncbi:MAG: hypothetical protein MI975_22080 [Cytophagales bacterium]|nr:hypothetical protein [Cytophagales bacterium]